MWHRRMGAFIVSGAIGCLASLMLAATATPAAAMATKCVVRVDGRDVTTAIDPGHAIPVQLDGTVTIEARTDAPPDHVRVELLFDPLSIQVWDGSPPPDVTAWRETIDVAPYASLGAGLYQVVATVDQCPPMSAWFRVEGRSPFTTVAGVAGISVLVVGVLLEVLSLVTALQGGRAFGRSIVGGVAIGAGALVVAQQSGAVPIDGAQLATWLVVPGGLGGLGQAAARSVARGRGRAPRTGGRTSPPPSMQPYPPYPPGPGMPPPMGPPMPPGPPYAPPPGPMTPGPPPGPMTPGPPPMAPGPPPAPPPPMAPPMPSGPAMGAPAGPAAGGAGVGAGGMAVGGAAAGSVADRQDPPRESFARMECPDAVAVGQPFPLVVGLAAAPDAGVVGSPMRRPETSVGPYTLTVQVVADGFALAAPGSTWRLDLPVTAEAPYPAVSLGLVAEPGSGPIMPRAIRAMYSVDGQPIGLAVRPIAVVADASLLGHAPTPPRQPAVDVGLPPAQTAPDLTVRIEPSDPPAPGRLLMQLLAADATIALPDAPMRVDIGAEPERFLRTVVDAMTAAEGQPGMYQALLGIGYTVAEQLPQPFWDVLAAIAARVAPRPPTVLFLSAEPYVPWELAVVDPPIDPGAPPFLSAQATLGRWVLGQRRPRLPPPATLEVHRLAVVSGVYGAHPGWQRLVDAEQEASEIAKRWHATPIEASSQPVLRLVKGDPPAELLHFAVHGQYDPTGAIDGLVLVDGMVLDPLRVRGSPLPSAPFVFLNACQVGAGESVLGDYAGLADAFLFAGASAVIAPLWSIDDVIARELALRFYEHALNGEPPAEVLRRERAAFRDDPSVTSSTSLAYQFFGHPSMRLGLAGDAGAPHAHHR